MAKKPTRKQATAKRQSQAAVKARQAKFLEAFVDIGTVHGAAIATGIGRKTHYNWLADEDYVAAFKAAEPEAVDRLAAEAHRRAIDGEEEPVFYKGEIVGHIRRRSDQLLMFLLKARDPAIYRDRVEHRHGNVEGEGPLKIQIAEVLADTTDADAHQED